MAQRFLFLFLALFFIIPVSLFAQDAEIERTYTLFVPKTAFEHPLPIVMVLHGASGSGERSQGWLGFDEIAETVGFIVVYPDGLGGQWDFGAGIPTTQGRVAIDDVGFLMGIIDELEAQYEIDSENIFVTGMSDGAAMAYRLICTTPEIFKAVVGVASTLPVFTVPVCEEAPPISAMFFHGTQDKIIPWNGIRTRDGQQVYLSVFDTMEWWSLHNKCDPAFDAIKTEDISDKNKEDNSTVSHVYQLDCADNTEVHLYGIIGGGHTWAGRPFDVEIELGNLNLDIDATQIIMAWFIEMVESSPMVEGE